MDNRLLYAVLAVIILLLAGVNLIDHFRIVELEQQMEQMKKTGLHIRMETGPNPLFDREKEVTQ